MNSTKLDNNTTKEANGSSQAEVSTESDQDNTKTDNDTFQDNCSVASVASSTSTVSSKCIKDLNAFITCNLCKGYLIDATTIIECLCSFCRACIVKYMDQESIESSFCPKCKKEIHKTKPKQNIRSDPTLQDIVYKLVPKLYKNEMGRRKEFYSKYPDKILGLSNEEKGEIHGERLILSIDDSIQLTIEYFPEVSNPYKLLPFKNDENLNLLSLNPNQRRFLLCKAGMKVLHLKKFIRYKYDLDSKIDVDFFYKHELLKDDYTIMDLAYIYSWRRNIPIPLYYIIIEPDKNKDDYIWLFSQSKMNLSRPLKTPKKHHPKSVLEPTNCNIKMTPQSHLVSKQNLLSKSVSLNSLKTYATPTSSSSSANKSKNKIKQSSLKRKVNINSSNVSNGKILKRDNQNTKEDSSKVNSSKINKNTSLSEDDSSTDISETSFQIEVHPKIEPTSSSNNETNISIDANIKLERTENAKENHSNINNQNIKFSDKESASILREGKDLTNKMIDICSNVIQKVEQSFNGEVQNGISESSSKLNKVKIEPVENIANSFSSCANQTGNLISDYNETSLNAALKNSLSIKSNKSNETSNGQPLFQKGQANSEPTVNIKTNGCLEDKHETKLMTSSIANNESLAPNSPVHSSGAIMNFLASMNSSPNTKLFPTYPPIKNNLQSTSIKPVNLN